jgi:hypothetical protein
MWATQVFATGISLADTAAPWTGPPPSVLGIAATLLGGIGAAFKVLYSAQSKTLDVERARVAEKDELLRKYRETTDQRIVELTEALRRRNESMEERVIPALIASAEATRAVLKATRRDSRD